MASTNQELSDDLNPEYLLNCINIELIKQIAAGEIDVAQLAQQSLEGRGMDINGEWIGFNNAKEYWNKLNNKQRKNNNENIKNWKYS